MAPPSSRARHVAALVGLVRSGGPFCIVLAVLTLCASVLWKWIGQDAARFALDGMTIARDTAIAQARANEAALKTVEISARTVDRYTELTRTSAR